MNYAIIIALFSCMLWKSINGGQLQEVQITPKPYAFSYKAGRMPGHIDRIHSEVGDETGVIKGIFSYVDPRQQVRTVEYLADKNGFHPLLITNPTQDTTAVENAKRNHFVLFNQIAENHAREAAERGFSENLEEDDNTDYGYDSSVLISHPKDTPVVERAKLRHYDLYNKIALEHAKIALERGHYDNGDYDEQLMEDREVKIGYPKY